jgi:hypothetical protein
MTGPSAVTPATPDPVRASDEERDQAVGELRERFAEGRLSHETFLHRMDAALGARNRHELARLVADLPPRRRTGGSLAGMAGHIGGGARRALEVLARERETLAGAVRDAIRPRPGAVAAQRRAPEPLPFPPGGGTRFTIGRDEACDLLIEDLTVSRLHATLSRDVSGWMLADAGSTNGTRLNGWRVREPVRVREGDRVTFGSATFVMCEGQPPGGQHT